MLKVPLLYQLIISFFIVTFNVFNTHLVIAQNYAYNYTQFDIEDGLPSSETYFAYQDEQGYMWFTTDRGIVKYNGYEFQTFTESDGLAELVNFKIHKDPQGGFITIGKEGKITTYKNGEFKPYEHNDSLTSIKYKSRSFHFEISCLTKNHILIKPIFLSEPLTIENYLYIERHSGKLSHISIDELSKIEIPLIKNQLQIIHEKYKGINRVIETITENNINYYLIKKYKSPSYFLKFKGTNLIESIKLEEKYAYIHIDHRNRIWVTSQNKLYYSTNGKYLNNLYKINMPEDIEISSMLSDSFGNIWIMTINGGLIKVSISPFIKSFPLQEVNKRIIKLYTSPPFLKFHAKSTNEDYFGLARDSILWIVNLDNYYLLENDSANSISNIDKELLFKPIVDAYQNFKFDPLKYPVLNIKQNKDVIGIEIFNSVHINFNSVFNVINSPTVYDFDFNKNNIIIGTAKGLLIIPMNNGSLQLNNVDTLLDSRINEIDKNKPNNYWIGTLKDGIYYYTTKKHTQIINPFHPTNSINAIEVSNDSIVYVGNSRGLYRLKYQNINDSIEITESYWFGKTEGLSSSYISGIEKYNNNIYIGTLNGLYYFNENDFKLNLSLPKIHIDNINLIDDNELLQPDELNELKSYQNNIQINYTGLYFLKEPQINYYRYSILRSHKDSEQKWIYTNNRSVLLNDLAPDDYTFLVQCRNNNNDWSDAASLKFTISPHFTQTWFFQGSLLLVLTLITWSYFRSRIKRKEREKEINEEMLSVKMQSTKSQMNPHFIFNGMNAIQNFIFKEDKISANRYISKFSGLIRDSLKMAQMDYISLKQEIEFVDRYLRLEQDRFPGKFDYLINVDSSISEEKVLIPPLMVQTLAENAVKHAFKDMNIKGHINISYEYDHSKQLLYIRVADNGKGLLNTINQAKHEEDKENTKLGLKLLQKRINIINQKYNRSENARLMISYFNKSKQTGTIITIIIPLNGNKN